MEWMAGALLYAVVFGVFELDLGVFQRKAHALYFKRVIVRNSDCSFNCFLREKNKS